MGAEGGKGTQIASYVQVTGTQQASTPRSQPLLSGAVLQKMTHGGANGAAQPPRGLARLQGSTSRWNNQNSASVGSLGLAGVRASNSSLCLLPNRYLCKALRMHTCTGGGGDVHVMSVRAYTEDELVSQSLGGVAPLLSCCLNDFLTVWGAMYPAVPSRHTNTPPWPTQGKGQRRAGSQDPSHNSAKVSLSLCMS